MDMFQWEVRAAVAQELFPGRGANAVKTVRMIPISNSRNIFQSFFFFFL